MESKKWKVVPLVLLVSTFIILYDFSVIGMLIASMPFPIHIVIWIDWFHHSSPPSLKSLEEGIYLYFNIRHHYPRPF